MIILKLGGSVITDKTKFSSFKKQTMDNLAVQIKRSNERIIIVHGAGSYGHILAKKHDLNNGFEKNAQMIGFSLTHGKVQELNSLVLDCLHDKMVPAVSLAPHSTVLLNDHNVEKISFDFFEKYLDAGFIPVTFGDVVLDTKLKFSICSGDLLMLSLAKHFKPEKVIFAMDEDGIYSSNPKHNNDAKLIRNASITDLENLQTQIDNHADVTGGMRGKINTIKDIASIGIDTYLLNGNKPDILYDVLSGKETRSTLVYGDK